METEAFFSACVRAWETLTEVRIDWGMWPTVMETRDSMYSKSSMVDFVEKNYVWKLDR